MTNYIIIIVPNKHNIEDFSSSTVLFHTVLKMEISIILNTQDESKGTFWAVIKDVHGREEKEDFCLMISYK